jgi:hypothetical protein
MAGGNRRYGLAALVDEVNALSPSDGDDQWESTVVKRQVPE